MGSSFVAKLALTNIKNNRKFYVPYILASIGTMTVFYIMSFLSLNKGIDEMQGNSSLRMIMFLGMIVIGLFSTIFLFYTNSFIIKRRKKEIGLYNILGMEKKHIAKIISMETLMVSGFSLLMGLACGVIFSKLAYLLLAKIISFEQPIVFGISVTGLLITAVLFGAIFALTLATNLINIKISKPIELLQGSNVGEKEPKTKIVLAIVGAICLGTGYYIAITTESPLQAILLFFVAVVLVIIGTYCLFTTGSIALLKALKKNKKFYYKAKNFTSISGMLYRMKQNAVGLANICILSTMVLVMISTTVSLSAGTQDILNMRFGGDVSATVWYDNIQDAREGKIVDATMEACQQKGLEVSNLKNNMFLTFAAGQQDGKFVFDTNNKAAIGSGACMFYVMTAQDYDKMLGTSTELKDNQIIYYSDDGDLSDTVRLFNTDYSVKAKAEDFTKTKSMNDYMYDVYYIVVANDDAIMHMYNEEKEAYEANSSDFQRVYSFDLTGTDEEKIAAYHSIGKYLSTLDIKYESFFMESQQETSGEYMSIIGGFLFLGIFLGLVFTFAAAMIIYYKQISEGYYDKDKFEIMQKVGMSKAEVKRSIRSQVLMVFFIPLLMAGIHVLAAFKMITRLLLVFSLTNVGLFALCTVITFLIFAVIYVAVYGVTAREYYKIVQQ